MKTSVAEIKSYIRSLDDKGRDDLQALIRFLVDQWVEKNNADGLLPAMQWWKFATKFYEPTRRATLDYFLRRTINNGAAFSIR